jgi:hypothetical protein
VLSVGEQRTAKEGGGPDHAGGQGPGPQDAPQAEADEKHQEPAHAHHRGQGLLQGQYQSLLVACNSAKPLRHGANSILNYFV